MSKPMHERYCPHRITPYLNKSDHMTRERNGVKCVPDGDLVFRENGPSSKRAQPCIVDFLDGRREKYQSLRQASKDIEGTSDNLVMKITRYRKKRTGLPYSMTIRSVTVKGEKIMFRYPSDRHGARPVKVIYSSGRVHTYESINKTREAVGVCARTLRKWLNDIPCQVSPSIYSIKSIEYSKG